MSLPWWLRRLRAMDPAEVATRIQRMVRDRLFPSPHCRVGAEEAFRLCFPAADPYELPSVAPRVLEMLENGPIPPEDPRRFRMFGREVTLDDPPNWRKNYVRGGEWPDAPTREIDYHDTGPAGGVKYTWEPSRHHMLTGLAFRYAKLGDEKAAETMMRWLEDWTDRNPVNRGVHWTSPLEMAVRVIVWSWCLRMLSGWRGLRDQVVRKVLGAMAQQACHIGENLSVGSSANNHLIGEACAMAYMGYMWPTCKRAETWRQRGAAIAEDEALRQIHPDGVPAEQSAGYLPFIWEFYVHLALAGHRFPPSVVERLDRSVEFVSAISSPGYVPQIGDEDDGCVLTSWGSGWDRYRIVADGMRRVLGTRPLEPECAGVYEFPDGGYTAFREGAIVAVFDHGPLGLGSLAAHGHADALSVLLAVGPQPILIDPGVYSYHEEPAWRDYFRSTRAHNTVEIDGTDQSERMGAFLWGRRCETRRTDDGRYEAVSPLYTASHRRRAALRDGEISVEDEVRGPFRNAAAHWHFHPGVTVSRRNEGALALSWNGGAAVMRFEPEPVSLEIVRGADRTPGLGWYSPAFGRLVPTTTAAVSIPRGDEARMKTTLSLGG